MPFDLQPRIPSDSYAPTSYAPSSHAPAMPVQPTLADVLAILRRRFWVIVLILLVAIATAILVTRRTAPMWRAHAQLILGERSTNLGLTSQQSPSPASAETIDTQLTMLQDHEMATRTLTLLKTQQAAQGQSVDSLGVTPEQLTNAITVSTPHDTEIIDVFVDANTPDKAALLGNGVCDAFIAWKKEVAQHNSQDALTNLEVRANRAQAALDQAEQQELQFKKTHNLVDPPAQSTALVSQSLTADTTVVALAQDLTTEQARLQALGGQLQGVEQAIRTGTGVRDDSIVLSLQSQLNQLEIDRADSALKVRAKYPSILPDLDAKIKDIQGRLSQAVQNTLDNKKPSLQSQAALFDNYKQAQIAVLLAQTKLNAAKTLQAQLKQEIAKLPETNLAGARLARNADLARTLTSSLQAGLNAARLEKDMVSGNIQLVQAADVPEKPVSPDLKKNLLVSAGIGLVLAIFAVMLLEQMDRRIRTQDGLRRIAREPIVGTLSTLSRAQIAALRRGELTMAVSEALNLTGINLDLLLRRPARPNPSLVASSLDPVSGPGITQALVIHRTDEPGYEVEANQLSASLSHLTHQLANPIIVVTSALPGEGKSVTAASLARTLARGGKRVILVDADLRRPAQDQMFPPSNDLGLADVLSGRVALADALMHSEVHRLLILHSGIPSDSAPALLSSVRLPKLIQELREAQCTVLIDTPACAVVGDTLQLAPYADCILQVVGAGIVEEGMVKQTTHALRAAAACPVAYFVNRDSGGHRSAYHDYYTPSAERIPNPESEVSGVGTGEPRTVSSLWDETE